MESANFERSNCILTPPKGMSEEQCRTIFGWHGKDEGGKDVIVIRFKPTKEEVESLAAGESIWVTVLGKSPPPISIEVAEDPFTEGG